MKVSISTFLPPNTSRSPAILEMKPFENGLFNLIENIKFRNARNKFQESSANNLNKINTSSNIFGFANKTKTFMKHRSTHILYDKLMHNNITKIYKHGSQDAISQIDDELKYISNKLEMATELNKLKNAKHLFHLKTMKEIYKTN